jgi:hypothetical protein
MVAAAVNHHLLTTHALHMHTPLELEPYVWHIFLLSRMNYYKKNGSNPSAQAKI